MLTNATFWLQLTMKSPQILMNLKMKAVKISYINWHYLFVKKSVKSCMRLQE